MEKISVVLADDHVLVRKGIKAMLESDTEINVVGEASSGLEALQVAGALKPNILVLDIRMPEMTGLEAAAKLDSFAPTTKAVILSMHDSEEYVLQALDAGAYGYLLKDTDKNEFVKALKQIHAGSANWHEQIIKDPEVERRFVEMGYVTTGSTPEEYQAKLKFETERWTKVVKDTGIKVES